MSHLLLKAASTGNLLKVRELLDQGAEIDYHSQNKQGTGRTALSEAAIAGHLEVTRLLIERRANLNWQDRAIGFTPLAWAADLGHVSIVEELLKAGADPNLKTPEYFQTALMAAAQRGNLQIVKLLTAAGADLNAATFDGRTALSIATDKKHDTVVTLLKGLGAAGSSPLPPPVTIPWPEVDQTVLFDDFASPEKVLRGFILAMNRWETRATLIRERQQIVLEMQQVFDIFCTPIERSYGRQGSYMSPPEYKPSELLIAITPMNPRKTEIVTRGEYGTIETEYLYVVLKKSGRWLIDSKKSRLPGATNWDKAIL